jgi:hypothetical protein
MNGKAIRAALDRMSITPEQKLAEIETLVAKATDALWHASEAIAMGSPGNRDFELRRVNEHLMAIAELAR